MNRKYVITHTETEYTKPATIAAIIENDKIMETIIEYDDDESELNNIYVAHVKDVVKNINSAFVEYEKGKMGYLALSEISDDFIPVFSNRKNTTKVCEGDSILVQLVKEPVKTKFGVVTTRISLNGKYIVIEYGKNQVAISKKINDNAFKDAISNAISPLCNNCSFIVRTDAINVSIEEIVTEATQLKQKLFKIIETVKYRNSYSLVHKADNYIFSIIKELYHEADEIICDSHEIISDIHEVLDNYYEALNIRYYDDNLLPLYKMYNIEGAFKQINSKNIWLNSGAYLVIEPTEAMTVIDVNTGKCDKGKNRENTFYKVNVEAAKEIMRQLRLRNISGIIMCDFINMENKENDEMLLSTLKELAKNDRLSTNIVDVTKLKLVEMTRKKVKDRIVLKK